MISEHYKKLLNYDQLSQEETMALVAKVQDGNKEAAWDLVCKNTKLVFRILFNHYPNHVNDESFSDGIFGLYNAIIRIREGSFFGHFVRFSTAYIKGYILRGIQRRSTQLSPSRTKNGFHTFSEISKDEIFEDYENDYPAFYGFFDPSALSPADSYSDEDRKEFIKRIAKHAYHTNNQATVFFLMGKFDGDIVEVAREMKKSRQYIHKVKNSIRKNLVVYLQKNPDVTEELLGKKSKYLLTNEKIQV